MKTLKKVTLRDFEKMVRKDNTVMVALKSPDIQFPVKYALSLDECILFVHDVAGQVIDELKGTYYPEAFDFIFKACVLAYYGQFEMPDEEADGSLDRLYDLVYQTDAAEAVMAAVHPEQLKALFDACTQRIEHSKQMSVQATGADLRTLRTSVEKLVDRGERLFGQLDDGELGALAQDLAKMSGAMSEDKIVDALIQRQDKPSRGKKVRKAPSPIVSEQDNVLVLPKPVQQRRGKK